MKKFEDPIEKIMKGLFEVKAQQKLSTRREKINILLGVWIFVAGVVALIKLYLAR